MTLENGKLRKKKSKSSSNDSSSSGCSNRSISIQWLILTV